MKLALLSALIAPIAFANPEIVTSPVDHLYVPQGFDSNDSVEVVVTGQFASPCYSRNNVDVKVNEDKIDIKISAIAPKAALIGSRACPDMVVPFKEVVSIGNLQGGKYKIRVNRDSLYALEDDLNVTEATSSAVDDHIYAAMEWIEKKGNNSFVMHGWKYSPCFELDKVEVISNKKDSLSILPVMKQVSDFCPMKGMPVSYPVKLDLSDMKTKKPLLYVRTMDGKSINTIVNFEGQK